MVYLASTSTVTVEKRSCHKYPTIWQLGHLPSDHFGTKVSNLQAWSSVGLGRIRTLQTHFEIISHDTHARVWHTFCGNQVKRRKDRVSSAQTPQKTLGPPFQSNKVSSSPFLELFWHSVDFVDVWQRLWKNLWDVFLEDLTTILEVSFSFLSFLLVILWWVEREGKEVLDVEWLLSIFASFEKLFSASPRICKKVARQSCSRNWD